MAITKIEVKQITSLAKGTIVVGWGTGVDLNVQNVGTNGMALFANSATSSGLEWKNILTTDVYKTGTDVGILAFTSATNPSAGSLVTLHPELRFDGTALRMFAGTTDGNVMTWSTSNGRWQESTPTSTVSATGITGLPTNTMLGRYSAGTGTSQTILIASPFQYYDAGGGNWTLGIINGSITNAMLASGGSITIGTAGILSGGGSVALGGTINLTATEADTLQTVTGRGATSNVATISLTGATPSTNTTTGTLVVTGGVGVSGAINAGGDVNVGGNAVITGNLTVNGTTTTLNVESATLVDPIFTLGTADGGAAMGTDDNKDRGIAFFWHNGTTSKTGFFGYDDSAAQFVFIPDATITNEVVSGTIGTINAKIAGTNITNLVTNYFYTAGGTVSSIDLDSGTPLNTYDGTATALTIAQPAAGNNYNQHIQVFRNGVLQRQDLNGGTQRDYYWTTGSVINFRSALATGTEIQIVVFGSAQ